MSADGMLRYRSGWALCQRNGRYLVQPLGASGLLAPEYSSASPDAAKRYWELRADFDRGEVAKFMRHEGWES